MIKIRDDKLRDICFVQLSLLGSSSEKIAVLLIFTGNIHINSLDEPDEADGFDEIHRKPIQVFI